MSSVTIKLNLIKKGKIMCKKPKIKVRVHKAFFVNDKDEQAYLFVNIANVAKARPFTITHLGFDHHSEVVDIIPTMKDDSLLFPCLLEASDCIEIPVPLTKIPDVEKDQEYLCFKVRDTDGNWYESKKQHTLLAVNRLLTVKTNYE